MICTTDAEQHQCYEVGIRSSNMTCLIQYHVSESKIQDEDHISFIIKIIIYILFYLYMYFILYKNKNHNKVYKIH